MEGGGGGGDPALVSVGAEVGALRALALTRTLLGEYVNRLNHYLQFLLQVKFQKLLQYCSLHLLIIFLSF